MVITIKPRIAWWLKPRLYLHVLWRRAHGYNAVDEHHVRRLLEKAITIEVVR